MVVIGPQSTDGNSFCARGVCVGEWRVDAGDEMMKVRRWRGLWRRLGGRGVIRGVIRGGVVVSFGEACLGRGFNIRKREGEGKIGVLSI